MRSWILLPLLLTLTTGCIGDNGLAPGEYRCGLGEAAVPDFQPRLSAEPYMGKSLNGAKRMATAEGGSIRVVGKDGSCEAALSDDLQDDRINVYLTDGRVTDAGVF